MCLTNIHNMNNNIYTDWIQIKLNQMCFIEQLH